MKIRERYFILTQGTNIKMFCILLSIILISNSLLFYSCTNHNAKKETSKEEPQKTFEELYKENRHWELSELSTENAYNILSKYNKIYHWEYITIIDNSYAPTKLYREYSNTELKLTQNVIYFRSNVFNIIGYKVFSFKSFLGKQLNSDKIIIKFRTDKGIVSFYHEKFPTNYEICIENKDMKILSPQGGYIESWLSTNNWDELDELNSQMRNER